MDLSVLLWILMKLLCRVVWWAFTLHLSLTPPPAQTGREYISISLHSERRHLFIVSQRGEQLACWYLFWRDTCRLQEILRRGHETQPDQESYRKQRGACWVDPGSCLDDVTQHFTGVSIFFDFNPHSLNTELRPESWTISSQLVSEAVSNNTPHSRSHSSPCNQHQLEIIQVQHFPHQNQMIKQTHYTNIGVCA